MSMESEMSKFCLSLSLVRAFKGGGAMIHNTFHKYFMIFHT